MTLPSPTWFYGFARVCNVVSSRVARPITCNSVHWLRVQSINPTSGRGLILLLQLGHLNFLHPLTLLPQMGYCKHPLNIFPTILRSGLIVWFIMALYGVCLHLFTARVKWIDGLGLSLSIRLVPMYVQPGYEWSRIGSSRHWDTTINSVAN